MTAGRSDWSVGYVYDWRDSGLLQTIRFALAMETRELEGREASPSAGVIDSQSVKGAEKGGARSTRPATMRARRLAVSSGI